MFVRAIGDVAKNSKLSVIDGSYRGLGLPPPLLFGSLYSADFHRWFYGNIHGHLEKFVNGIDISFWSFLLLFPSSQTDNKKIKISRENG